MSFRSENKIQFTCSWQNYIIFVTRYRLNLCCITFSFFLGGFYKLALECSSVIFEQILVQDRRSVASYVPRTWNKRCRKEARAAKDNS